MYNLFHRGLQTCFRASSASKPQEPLIRPWIPPEQHLLKFNMDPAFGNGGSVVGGLTRNHKGKIAAITYRLPDGTTDVYEPLITEENPDEVKLVGAYPDFVVHNLAAERDDLQSKVILLQQKVAQAQAQAQQTVAGLVSTDFQQFRRNRVQQQLAQAHAPRVAAPAVNADWQSTVNRLQQLSAQARAPRVSVSAPAVSADLQLLQANHLQQLAAHQRGASAPVTTGWRLQQANPQMQQPPTVGTTGFTSRVNRAGLHVQARQRLAAGGYSSPWMTTNYGVRPGRLHGGRNHLTENSAGSSLTENSDAGGSYRQLY